jgi:copper(I)-binding protein
MRAPIPALLVAMLLGAAAVARADVTVRDAWVRGTVPAQKATGAFLTLTSTEDAKVVAASSPVAGMAQIHVSESQGGIMRMHAIDGIELPAGKAVELQPGGSHIMLMQLAHPLAAGDSVALALTIEDRNGKRTVLEVRAPVRPLGK